jgi:hypothetical protein
MVLCLNCNPRHYLMGKMPEFLVVKYCLSSTVGSGPSGAAVRRQLIGGTGVRKL